ncbi:membrane protein insertase YidC [Agrilutibacter solisilvae]|uniref:Membrane protein insertase YidC n=1 Tax=Agrilutibacter solisilvae TaxID=2763317 RepID=A0A975ATD6_9GAMM|nr:membrane protein insertase YidC [Lysobacter solisilvae]QSX79178.1 membrane protein insertase YidC [Lysobacter solisilvae]
MNSTRLFLLFAWLMVATLLWMEWGKEQAAPVTPAVATTPAGTVAPTGSAGVPSANIPTATGTVPAAPGSTPAPVAASATPEAAPAVTVETDVLRVTMTGGELRQADLLRYPSEAAKDSAPVRLLSPEGTHYFVATTGWHSDAGPAPETTGFVLAGANAGTAFRLAPGQKQLVVPFVWNGANGVSIRREFVFERGSYVVQVRDQLRNAGSAPWQGYVYRGLTRAPRPVAGSGPMSPESYSFQGPAWWDDKYERCKYEDIGDDCKLGREVKGGWIGMLQHHFFGSWIPQKDQAALFDVSQAGGHYTIDARGPSFNVAAGGSADSSARLWIGPKLVNQMEAQDIPGLKRAVDFSKFDTMATLAEALFWVLEKLHALVKNWGWAIVGLVVLIKILMFPLSTAQYKSMAKMRKFQPRIKQLQERYGEDKQKLQMAMMELYKKEKINPVGGCLPILIQMPVFLALYWMLSESVELRHAPWIGWITDLTARDPYFVLPVINIAVMWFTQKLTPMAPGMDPMQQKMMQYMPLVFGVLFAFMPAGLVLYWITNGTLGLLQQAWMTRRYAEQPAKLLAD